MALGWRTNEKESGLPSTCGEFIGVPFDTDAFVFTITDAKRDKLHRRVLKCLRLDSLSLRRVAKLRGKLLWHGTALDYAH
eukprot:2638106-Rhodomonas_salina.1